MECGLARGGREVDALRRGAQHDVEGRDVAAHRRVVLRQQAERVRRVRLLRIAAARPDNVSSPERDCQGQARAAEPVELRTPADPHALVESREPRPGRDARQGGFDAVGHAARQEGGVFPIEAALHLPRERRRLSDFIRVGRAVAVSEGVREDELHVIREGFGVGVIAKLRAKRAQVHRILPRRHRRGLGELLVDVHGLEGVQDTQAGLAPPAAAHLPRAVRRGRLLERGYAFQLLELDVARVGGDAAARHGVVPDAEGERERRPLAGALLAQDRNEPVRRRAGRDDAADDPAVITEDEVLDDLAPPRGVRRVERRPHQLLEESR